MMRMRAAAIAGLTCTIPAWFAGGAAWVHAFQQRPAPAEAPPAYPGYSLVWSDEFERDGKPDPSKWT